jgi:hypothetical protein
MTLDAWLKTGPAQTPVDISTPELRLIKLPQREHIGKSFPISPLHIDDFPKLSQLSVNVDIDNVEIPKHPYEPSPEDIKAVRYLTSQLEEEDLEELMRESTPSEDEEEKREQIEKYARDRKVVILDEPTEIHESDPDYLKLKPAIDPNSLNYTGLKGAAKDRIMNITESHAFKTATTRRDQIELLCSEVRDTTKGKRMSFTSIASLMNIPNSSSVSRQWKKITDGARHNGPPSLMSLDAEKYMYQIIEERFKSKDSITLTEIVDLLQYQFSINISDDTLRHYIYRNPNLKTAIGIPTDEKRVHTSDSEILSWYQELDSIIQKIPAAFIYNMDETGCND